MLRLGFERGFLCLCVVGCCGVCVDSLRGMIGGLSESHCCVNSRDVVFVFKLRRGDLDIRGGLGPPDQISRSGCDDGCRTRNARDARSHD